MPRSSSTWNKVTRPAPKGPGRKKGSKNRATLLKEQLGVSNWSTLKVYLESRGIDRLISELERLKGKDYVSAWYHLAEYVRPRLHRDTAPQDKGGENIQNNYYLSLPVEDQIKLVELHQRAQQLAQGLTESTVQPILDLSACLVQGVAEVAPDEGRDSMSAYDITPTGEGENQSSKYVEGSSPL